MLVMPATRSHAPVSRLSLLPIVDHGATRTPAAPKIRRYRLARIPSAHAAAATEARRTAGA